MDDPMRIMVVADNADLRIGIARLLEKAGYFVDQVVDGELALQAIQQRQPDLLLLDRDMPSLDGLEVCRRIKQDPACADMAIILISGVYPGSSHQAEGLEFGADDYIARPIANRELLARVKVHIRILSLIRTLQSKVQELEKANTAASQGALAALRLREDAVAARDQMNATNELLRQEIEERKRSEEALLESEAKFRRLFQDNRAILGLSIEKDGRYIDVSEEFLAVTGYSREEVIGKNASDLGIWVDPKDRSLLVDELRKNLKVRDLDLQICTKSGELRILLCNVERLDFEGESCLLVSAIDVTERKQAEEALRESERFLASTLDGLSSHIAVIDASGEIVLTNKIYRDFAAQNGGDPRAVSEGANYITVCDAARGEGSDGAARFGEAIRRVLDGSCPSFELEYPCNAPDRKRWFIGRVTPFRGDGPRRAVVAHEDITERKNAEFEIRDLSRHLMTIQEEERQRVARDLHDSVGQTVLAAKLNIEAYLKDKSDGERLGNGLAFLDRASQELRSIYNGLYPSMLDDLGFEAAVRWYARHILEANGISVSLDIALESQINPTTAVNLYRIVQEILSNVLKHSGSDSVMLDVHEKGGMITLTVQDKGIGFDENKPGVDSFGLVSLRYRAKLLGGECRIDSKTDEGTTVTVTAMRTAT